MLVIADTTPLRYLVVLGHVDLLPAVFGQVLIPPAVAEEFSALHKGCTRGILRPSYAGGIRAEKPQITESELRQELFLRYYGDEFSPEQRKKILAAIADYWRRKEAAQDA
jgi:hypothetical protein